MQRAKKKRKVSCRKQRKKYAASIEKNCAARKEKIMQRWKTKLCSNERQNYAASKEKKLCSKQTKNCARAKKGNYAQVKKRNYAASKEKIVHEQRKKNCAASKEKIMQQAKIKKYATSKRQKEIMQRVKIFDSICQKSWLDFTNIWFYLPKSWLDLPVCTYTNQWILLQMTFHYNWSQSIWCSSVIDLLVWLAPV